MPIAIQIVKEDLDTIISYPGSIDVDREFYALRRLARNMNLQLIGMLDDAGDTLINKLQLPILKDEIQRLRKEHVKQEILDILQKAVDEIHHDKHYIKFIGD